MEKYVSFKLDIDFDLAEKFNIALRLNKEDSNEAISRMMVQYVSESFSKASKSVEHQPKTKADYSNDGDTDYAKASRKIPKWAHKPHQNNHKIIKAFFEVEDEFGFVTVETLSQRCKNSTEYPDTFCSGFEGNFAQMKTDAGNSHGKVFIVNDDVVEVWREINQVLMIHKHLFM